MESTKNYAESTINNDETEEVVNRRKWKNVSLGEIKHFLAIIAIIMYMGQVKIGDKRDYWINNKEFYPKHPIMEGLGLTRFEQIKRYFHIEDLRGNGADHRSGEPGDTNSVTKKVQWLIEDVNSVSQLILDPGSVLSYDEAMIRCFGRSKHTIMAKHKPTKQGYEAMVFAIPGGILNGYVTAFDFQDKSKKPSNPSNYALNDTNLYMIELLNRITPTVDGNERKLVIFADNRFINVNVAAYLREKGTGICGTVRINAQGLTPDVKKMFKDSGQNSDKYSWGDLETRLVKPKDLNTEVLAVSWIDSNAVSMMTTTHTSHLFTDYVKKVGEGQNKLRITRL